ncbi:RXT2-like protein [Exophiala viscosa]|uniref:RXT2-like protein n=1 Tax=Exophiala viscosa TaxID=2486360 RepID=A0AAN6IFS1_9EURO|nr:RXT2-like protein [Exophiala viscosa]
MPPQHVEIAETIAALKKALRREKEAPADQSISAATNRGNKLKKGANQVHAGALPYAYGPSGYKQKIEHAGYTRYILDRKPKRYNEYGDELEDSESDTEADADAEDENPYAGIRLEELLCPLKHPAELATHPTLSLPFLDSALPDMVRSIEDKLRQERANLWRAKSLNRQFMGDEPWLPCASVEGPDDWDMFAPKPKVLAQQAGKKRKRDSDKDITQNGVNGHDYAHEDEHPQNKETAPESQAENAEDAQVDGQDNHGEKTDPEIEQETKDQPDPNDGDLPTANGVHAENHTEVLDVENGNVNNEENGEQNLGEDTAEKMEVDEGDDNTASDEEAPQPTRRITRALAAENNVFNAASPPLSPHSTASTIDSSLLQIDPMFLLPPSFAPNNRAPRSLFRFGLPVEEFIETRRLLTVYIQKQEESVRGYEAVLGKLIKAKRLRDKVWEWCKTEGHVGEWSDGEDWVDAEAWGLAPEELKKGKDEEEVEGQEETGRKGKRRRRD